MTEDHNIITKASQLLIAAGHAPTVTSLTPCTRGGNNRTFRLETPTKTFALKEYFRQEADTRDRLQSEYAFLTYAQKAAPTMTPRAYAKDDKAGLALYEFIEGEPLQAGEVEKEDVMQAADFFCALNNASSRGHDTASSRAQDTASSRGHDTASSRAQARDPAVTQHSSLPNASEARFSLQAHLDLVEARVQTLTQINAEIAEDEQALTFIKNLESNWRSIKQEVITHASKLGIPLNTELSDQDRCISPSDFGFHNALKTRDGKIKFIDFEYAGWDDPAKMVGDFFSQLAVPVPASYFEEFTQKVMQPFPDKQQLINRAKLLRKVYQIKWCCIALNVFIPVHLARRKFANPQLNEVDIKKSQLAKAENLIQRLEANNYV